MFLGVAFKKNVDDIRNSPGLKIIELLLQRGAQNVSYNDPFVPEVKINGTTFASQELSDEVISQKDCVIITTDHSSYDVDNIVKHAKLIVDTRNATKSVTRGREKIIRLGCGTT